MYSTPEDFKLIDNWLKENEIPEILWTALDGHTVAYFVANEQYHEEVCGGCEVPLYAVQIFWSNDNEYRIVVWPDVPEDLRGLWAWHEALDHYLAEEHKTVYRSDGAPWCPDAERYIQDLLKESNSKILPRYRHERAKFWQSMAKFAEVNFDKPFKHIDIKAFTECIALCVG
jgi:hypothetical protein